MFWSRWGKLFGDGCMASFTNLESSLSFRVPSNPNTLLYLLSETDCWFSQSINLWWPFDPGMRLYCLPCILGEKECMSGMGKQRSYCKIFQWIFMYLWKCWHSPAFVLHKINEITTEYCFWITVITFNDVNIISHTRSFLHLNVTCRYSSVNHLLCTFLPGRHWTIWHQCKFLFCGSEQWT